MNSRLTCSLMGSAAIATLWLSLSGCTTVPVTGRHELNLISSDQEMQLGLSSFDQLKQGTPVEHDPAMNALVERVGRRVAAVAGKDLPNAKWEFVVFKSQEANAFCLPGGKVGVYTGLLPITKDEAGLATVLGHEIGHAVAHHGASRMTHEMISQGIGKWAGSEISASQYAQYQSMFMGVYGLGSQVLVELPYSREQESEADHIGLIYMARAGYDPSGAVEFWKRFAAYNQQQSGGAQTGFLTKFLRTHPVDEVRIKDLQQLQPQAQAEYAKTKPH